MAGLVHPLAEAASLGSAYRIGGSAALGALIGVALARIRHVADKRTGPGPNPLSDGLTQVLRDTRAGLGRLPFPLILCATAGLHPVTVDALI
jgi:hypothetical protein